MGIYVIDISLSSSEETIGGQPALKFTSPPSGYTATSPSLSFSWVGSGAPNNIITVYSDAARTSVKLNSLGNPMESDNIGSATSHTFSNDITDGGARYVKVCEYDVDWNEIQCDTLQITAHTDFSAVDVQLSPSGGALAGSTREFTVSNLPSGYTWGLNAGTSGDIDQYFNSGAIVATGGQSITATGLPTDGSVVVVTLYAKDGSGNITTKEYSGFTAFNSGGGGGGDRYDSLQAITPAILADVEANGGQVHPDYLYTSTGGYTGYPVTTSYYWQWRTTGDASWVQKAVTLAMYYVDAGADMSGYSVHGNVYYPTNGYKDWIWGNPDPNYYGKINHYHAEWRQGAMVAMALRALQEHGGSGITPSDAESKMLTMLRHDVWDKYSSGVNAPNTPPALQSRTLEGAIGTDEVARLCNIALVLDKADPNPGSNRYFTYFNSKMAVARDEIIATGGYLQSRTDTADNSGLQPMDISHAGDYMAAFDLSTVLGHTAYNTTAMRNSVGAYINSTLYPTSLTGAMWVPNSNGDNPGYWGSPGGLVSKYWGLWATYVSDADINRVVDDYLAAQPLSAGEFSVADFAIVSMLSARLI